MIAAKKRHERLVMFFAINEETEAERARELLSDQANLRRSITYKKDIVYNQVKVEISSDFESAAFNYITITRPGIQDRFCKCALC